jgi:hypothetical protein
MVDLRENDSAAWGAIQGANCLEELNDCQRLKEDLVYGVGYILR